MSVPSVEEYVNLADLARRLTAYRYRVFTAATQLSVGLCVAVLYMLWQVAGYAVLRERWIAPLIPVIFFLSFFVPLYFIASFIWRTYWRSVRALGVTVRRGERGRERLIPFIYALPIILVYAIPPPLPHWYSYAWFYGLTVSHMLETLLFEIPLARTSPEYSTISHRVTTILSVAASPIPAVISLGAEAPFLPAHAAVAIALAAYLVAAILELRRAERLA